MASMSLEDAQALIAYFTANAEEFKPVVSGFLDAIGTYEPEINRVLNNITDAMVDGKARAIKRLEEMHGFTREEAIRIALRIESDFIDSLKNSKAKKK